jgi:hypothetical protein
MTVAELLEKLGRAYGLFNANALETWAPVFRARLGRFEGDALRDAFTDTLSTFKPKSVAPFPVPLDFEQHLPERQRDHDRKPPLDLEGHQRRKVELMTGWLVAQGLRASKDIQPLMWALTDVANRKAGVAAWNPACRTLLLTRDELMVALKCALSQERRRQFGPMPKSNEVWWSQIITVATAWGVVVDEAQWNNRKMLEAAE